MSVSRCFVLCAGLGLGAVATADPDSQRLIDQARRSLDQTRQQVLADVERLRLEATRAAELDLELPTPQRLALEERRRKLKADVQFWLAGQSAWRVDAYEMNYAIADALQIARADGLDVDKLTRIYEQMRKVLRTASFEDPQIGPPPDQDDRLSTYFASLFTFAHNSELALSQYRARLGTYRQGLYKKVGAAFVRALISGRDLRPPCDLRQSRGREVELQGQRLSLFGCPDPVVDNLRAYLQALRTLQSAEVETAAAGVEELVAEQQLAADLLSGVPLLGEALDIYAVYAGENLAGQPLVGAERAVMTLFISVPIVGPKLLEQICRRSPAAADALARLSAYAAALLESGQWFLRETSQGLQEVYLDMARQAFGREQADALLRRSAARLDEARQLAQRVLAALADDPEYVHPDKSQWFIHQKLRNAVQDQIELDALPRQYRDRARADAQRGFRELLGQLQAGMTREQRIKMSGIVAAHAEALSHVAKKRNKLLLMRHVNPDATAHIARDAATKWMDIKAKSAIEPLIAGAIPIEQSLNKAGTELRRLRGELRAAESAGEVARIETLRAQVHASEYKLAQGWEAVEACRRKACAHEIPFKKDGKTLHHVNRPGSEGLSFVLEDGRGGWLDAQSGRPVDLAPGAAPKPVMVYGTADGRIITADYDVFAFGERGGKRQQPGFNRQTGFTTAGHDETIDAINRAVQGKDPEFNIQAHGGKPYEGGNVVHHGAEENFFGTPGLEDPYITVFEPSGAVVQIPQCDFACMQAWCRAAGPDGRRRCDPARVCPSPQRAAKCIPLDRERLAKDYFHLMRSMDWHLDPNPAWGWGQYNALGGWLPPYANRGAP